MESNSLGAFLRSRRDRVTPADVGLRTYGTARRVPGLRREELAQLAGVSAGYYTRLEQDQAGTASAQVLDSLARVLLLNADETAHLHNLSRRPAVPRMVRPRPERPHARVLTLLRSLGESVPAIVWGRRGDVLAWNRTGHALFAEHLDFAAPTSRPGAPPTRGCSSWTRTPGSSTATARSSPAPTSPTCARPAAGTPRTGGWRNSSANW